MQRTSNLTKSDKIAHFEVDSQSEGAGSEISDEHDDIDPLGTIETLIIKEERIENEADDESLYSIVGRRRFNCRLCEFTTESMERIEVHVISHAHEKLYHSHFECRECLKWLMNENKLRMHFETHSKSFTSNDMDPGVKNDLVITENECKNEMLTFEDDDYEMDESFSFLDKSEEYFKEKKVPKLTRHSSRLYEGNKQTQEKTKNVIKNEQFECDYCSTKFSEKHALKYHMRTHMKINYHCETCSEDFGNKIIFLNHRLRIHSIKENICKYYKCDVCSMQFTAKSTFERHQLKHTGEKPFSCDKCPSRFTRKHSLVIHVKTAHVNEEGFNCPICTKKFKSNSALQSHIKAHQDKTIKGEKKFCEICSVDFGNRKILLDHLLRMHNIRDGTWTYYDCDVCSMQFTAKSIFERHQLKHTGEKPFACNMCTSRYTRKFSLTAHIKAAHGYVDEKYFRCHICPKTFKTRNCLQIHMQACHDETMEEEKLLCEICTKQLTKKAMRRHLLSHSGMKNFACKQCEFKTYSESELKIHTKRMHEEKLPESERPFGCDQCSKEFMIKSDLDSHLAVHSSERPFECDMCDKKYSRKSGLDYHMLCHKGERSHQCNECVKRFLCKTNLSEHVRTVHRGEKRPKSFKCDQCDKTFQSNHRLEQHVENTHAN